jgi:hypothetical protein
MGQRAFVRDASCYTQGPVFNLPIQIIKAIMRHRLGPIVPLLKPDKNEFF